MKVIFTIFGLCVSGCDSAPAPKRDKVQASRDAVTRCADAGGFVIQYRYTEETDTLVVECGQYEEGQFDDE